MLELQGKFAKATVYTDIIDSETTRQIIDICNHPIAENSKIKIMPDCHAGSGCIIGFTATINKKMIIPNIVGDDISCGVMTTVFKAKEIDFKKLDNFIVENIPHGLPIRDEAHNSLKNSFSHIAKLIEDISSRIDKDNLDYHLKSVGTLGGGNHYIEIGKISEDLYSLSVHTGSRKLGVVVCKHYQNKAKTINIKEREKLIDLHKTAKTPEEHNKIQYDISLLPRVSKEQAFILDTDFDNYISDMLKVEKIANANRACISSDIVDFLQLDVVEQFDTTHNYIELKNEEIIVRKGAIRAEKGEKVAIPLNMRDGVILGIGKGNPDWNYSAPHGAGRIMSRARAKETLSMDQFQQSMKNIKSWSVKESTLDEAPQAYKDADMIIDNIKETVSIEAISKPLFNFKSR